MATLLKWMTDTDISVLEAAKAFGVSTHAVRKWLKYERTPRPRMQAHIQKVTRGAVTPSDWVADLPPLKEIT